MINLRAKQLYVGAGLGQWNINLTIFISSETIKSGEETHHEKAIKEEDLVE